VERFKKEIAKGVSFLDAPTIQNVNSSPISNLLTKNVPSAGISWDKKLFGAKNFLNASSANIEKRGNHPRFA
jgi:hypothetical protein